MTQAMIQDTVILNKFHQLTPEQQQQMLDFMDFLLFKKEIKDDTITQMRVGDRWLVSFKGDLSFKEAKKSVPGRPRIPQGAEVDYDVEVMNIPGMGDDFIADFE